MWINVDTFLHMTDFSPQALLVVAVTNMRYENDVGDSIRWITVLEIRLWRKIHLKNTFGNDKHLKNTWSPVCQVLGVAEECCWRFDQMDYRGGTLPTSPREAQSWVESSWSQIRWAGRPAMVQWRKVEVENMRNTLYGIWEICSENMRNPLYRIREI